MNRVHCSPVARGIGWQGDHVSRDHSLVADDLEAYRQAEMVLLAAGFAFPDPHRPDVDCVIDLACRLLAADHETPGMIEVACLRYGTPIQQLRKTALRTG